MTKLDKLYMDISCRVSQESQAMRRRVGCVIVKDGNIISFAWNGTPRGFDNTCEDEEFVTKPEVVHSEINAFAKLVKTGVSCNGATVYLTLSPCYDCSKMIISSGIKRVVYLDDYRNTEPLLFLRKAGIEVTKFSH